MSRPTACLQGTCDRCGFIPRYACQVDVIDVCREDNDMSINMMLCVNCQRLMEAMDGGYLSPAELAELKGIWRQGDLFN